MSASPFRRSPSRLPHRPASRLLSALLAALLAAGSAIAAPSASDLQNDLAHYRRDAAKSGLGANDRLYILTRLRHKYADASIDLTELEAESALWRDRRAAAAEAKPAPKKSAPPPLAPAPAAAKPASTPAAAAKTRDKPRAPGPPALTRVRIEDETAVTKLILSVSGPVAPQAVWVEDALRPDQPMLLIDLPKTRDQLSAVAREMLWGSGPLISATTAANGDGVRVQIVLRRKHAYRVSRAGGEIVIEVGNDPAPPETPAAAAAPAEDANGRDAVISPGDVLAIEVGPAKELSNESVVGPDGALLFPLIGSVNVGGMTAGQAQKTLAARLAPYVKKASVVVTPKRLSGRNVFVTGQVRKPGAVPFGTGLRLLEALGHAGGYTDDANSTAVKIHRGGKDGGQVLDVNPQAILAQGDLSLDVPLEPGDVIEVPRGTNSIFVSGRVAKPGNYPYHPGLTVFGTVSMAGGTTLGAGTGAVKIFRENGAKRDVLTVNLARIMAGRIEGDIALQPGDVVLVPERSLFGISSNNAWAIPWLYLATLIAAVVIAR